MFSECRSAWWCPSHHSPWVVVMPSKGPTTSVRYGYGWQAELKWVKSHILYSYYKYIRPNILNWCTRSIYISLCARGFVPVSSHAYARVSMRLFLSFFSGYSLVVAWHRQFCSVPLCLCMSVRETEKERRKGWVKDNIRVHVHIRTHTHKERERERERERETHMWRESKKRGASDCDKAQIEMHTHL
jgi:hypothetical protein